MSDDELFGSETTSDYESESSPYSETSVGGPARSSSDAALVLPFRRKKVTAYDGKKTKSKLTGFDLDYKLVPPVIEQPKQHKPTDVSKHIEMYFTDNILAVSTTKNTATFNINDVQRYIQFARDFGNMVAGNIIVGVHYTLVGEMFDDLLTISYVKRSTPVKLNEREGIRELITNYYRMDPSVLVFHFDPTLYLDLVVTSSALFPSYFYDGKIESGYIKLDLVSRKFSQDNIIKAIMEAINYVPPKNMVEARRNDILNKKLEFMTARQRKAIFEMINKLRENTEVEMSLGRFSGKYIPGITKEEFYNLKQKLEERTGKKPHVEESKVTLQKDGNVRKVEYGKRVIYEEKTRDYKNKVDNIDFGWRVTSSTEKAVSKPSKFVAGKVRNRKRYTFKIDNYVIDMTEVSTPSESNNYEVEVEFGKKIKIDEVVRAMEFVYLLYRGVDSFDDISSDVDITQVINEHNRLFINDNKDSRGDLPSDRLYDARNKPVNLKINELLKPANSWSMTVKYDGERRMLFITRAGTYLINAPNTILRIGDGDEMLSGTLIDGELMEADGTFYAFDILFLRRVDIRRTTFPRRYEQIPNLYNSPVMGDYKYKVKEYLIGGDLYYNVTKTYKKMLELGDKSDGIIYQSNGYYINRDTYKWKPADKMTIDFHVDKETLKLMSSVTKGKKQFLIDFRKAPNNKLNPRKVMFDGVDLRGKIVEFVWDRKHKEFVPIRVRTDRDAPNNINIAIDVWYDIMDPILSTTICGDDLVIMRKYHNRVKTLLIDKEIKFNMYAKNARVQIVINNEVKGYANIIEHRGANIYRIINEYDGEIEDIDSKYMRYTGTKGKRILDIGTGRGGDIGKYENAGVKVLFAVEPNNDNIKELKRRVSLLEKQKKGELSMDIVYINDKAENVQELTKQIGEYVKDKPETVQHTPVNDVTSFFSLTFFFKDKETYDKLIKLVSDFVPAGGKFMGICFDGERVRNELSKNSGILEGSVYNMNDDHPFVIKTKKSSGKELELGDTVEVNISDSTSMVKSQTEWLVDFDRLTTDLNERGFIKERDEFLDSGVVFNTLPEGAKEFSSLNRLFVFRKPNKRDMMPENVLEKVIKEQMLEESKPKLGTEPKARKTDEREEYVESEDGEAERSEEDKIDLDFEEVDEY